MAHDSTSSRDEQDFGKQSAGIFEAIRHRDAEGGEYWSARELMRALTYTEWRNFSGAIRTAMTACETSGYGVSDHFVEANKMIPLGKGAQRAVEDYHLSRYACYLIVQNADPSKSVVALGQTYFAVQAERTRLADQASRDALTGLDENARRLLAREQLAKQNATLADAAHVAGVVTSRDFAVFQDHGYRGLYAGERAQDIATRKGLKKGARILDHMGSEELAANLFRATQTEAKLRRDNVTGRENANQTHHDVGAAVRHFIIDTLGGTPPEQLPTPTESVAELQARERKAVESERQPSLFDTRDSANTDA